MEEIDSTKGNGSASERVNDLLRLALDCERLQRMEVEAEAFFAKQHPRGNRERAAFQKATRRSISRD